MKFRNFRHPKIHERIRAAADQWREAGPGRAFESADAISLSRILGLAGIALLFAILLIFLTSSWEDGPLFLSVVLPVIAILTFLRIIHGWHSQSSSEATYLLPFSNQRLSRQNRADLLTVILLGSLPAALAGSFGGHSLGFILGGLHGVIIYLGLLGCLTLSYYWKFFTLFTFLSKAAFSLLILGQIVAPLKRFNIFIIEATPWFQAFHSPVALGGFFALGTGIAFATRKRWGQITRFDRTSFYEHHKSGVPASDEFELPEDDLIEVVFEPRPAQPAGIFEKFLWKFFTPREKGLLRASGWTNRNFLKEWLKVTGIFIVACWLTNFSWPAPVADFRASGPFVLLWIMLLSTRASLPTATEFLGGIVIAPKSTAAQFQALPITLNRLEKLLLKDGVFRWFLSGLTLALAPFFHSSLEASVFHGLILLGLTFLVQVHGTLIYFANATLKDWVPLHTHERAWSIAIGFWLVLGVLGSFLVLGTTILSIDSFFKGDEIFSPTQWIAIFGGTVIFHLILRAMIRALIANPRSDLIREA